MWIIGYCIYLRLSLISWKFKKQTIISCSSWEAKYITLASTTCKIQWLTFLLDLHIIENSLASLYCDNQTIRRIALNSSFHERTKHVNINCHVVSEKIQVKLFRLLPISIDEELVDIFSKTLNHGYSTFLFSRLDWWIFTPQLKKDC